MEKLRSVHIELVVEAKIPQNIDIRTLGMGIAGSKIHDHCTTIPEAQILTWWVEKVHPCNSQYVTCPKCHKIGLISHDVAFLDGKPMCIGCSAEFTHGDQPNPRTAEEQLIQLAAQQHRNA